MKECAQGARIVDAPEGDVQMESTPRLSPDGLSQAKEGNPATLATETWGGWPPALAPR